MRQLYVVIGDYTSDIPLYGGELCVEEQYWNRERACIETKTYIYGEYVFKWDALCSGVLVHFIPWWKQ